MPRLQMASELRTRPRAVDRYDFLAGLQIAAAFVLLAIWFDLSVRPWQNDAFGYWRAWDGGLYNIPWLDHGAYTYSPAFAQAEWPWTLLPWRYAWPLEVAAQLLALTVICGPLLALVLYLVPLNPLAGYPNPIAATVYNGNLQLLLALAVVAAKRWPAAWAFVIHTKITPGVGILWYAVRRDWRALAIALGVTAVAGAVSFIVAPYLWFEWFGLLRSAAAANALSKEPVLAVALVVRLPVAALLVIWGSRTDRYWTVPVGAMLALPAIQLGGFAVAVGVVPLLIARNSRLAPIVPAAVRRFWRMDPSASVGSHGAEAGAPPHAAEKAPRQ